MPNSSTLMNRNVWMTVAELGFISKAPWCTSMFASDWSVRVAEIWNASVPWIWAP